jgi:hypothetical protein
LEADCRWRNQTYSLEFWPLLLASTAAGRADTRRNDMRISKKIAVLIATATAMFGLVAPPEFDPDSMLPEAHFRRENPARELGGVSPDGAPHQRNATAGLGTMGTPK